MTAIVGQNGTGKTTLLRFIQELKSGYASSTDYVTVFETNGKYSAFIYRKNNDKYEQLPIEGGKDIDNYGALNNIDPKSFFEKYVRVIYLTEMFNMAHYTDNSIPDDNLSFAGVLRSQTENGFEESYIANPVVKYIHRMIDWQLEFLSNGIKYTEWFKINYPVQVKAELSYDRSAFEAFYKKVKYGKNGSFPEEYLQTEARRYLDNFLNERRSSDSFSLKNEFAKAVFMNIFTSFEYLQNLTPGQEKVIFEMIELIPPSLKNTWDIVYDLLKDIQERNEKREMKRSSKTGYREDPVYIPVEAGRYIEFMDYLNAFLSRQKSKYIKAQFGPAIWIRTDDNMETFGNFYNNYKKCVRIVDFISFSWGLSSGETLLLNQFGKLAHLLYRDKDKYFCQRKNIPKPGQRTRLFCLMKPKWLFIPNGSENILTFF